MTRSCGLACGFSEQHRQDVSSLHPIYVSQQDSQAWPREETSHPPKICHGLASATGREGSTRRLSTGPRPAGTKAELCAPTDRD